LSGFISARNARIHSRLPLLLDGRYALLVGTIPTMHLGPKTFDLLPEDLELSEQAVRSLMYRYQLDAEAAKGTSIERVHLESRAKLPRGDLRAVRSVERDGRRRSVQRLANGTLNDRRF
jgi:hypothetical protein